MDLVRKQSAIAVLSALALATGVAGTNRSPFAQEHPIPERIGNGTRAAAILRAAQENLPFVPGEVLIRFRAGVDAGRQQSALRAIRAEVRRDNSRWIGDTLHVINADITDPEHAAALLRAQPEVLYAHPNYVARNKSIPNDSSYSNQWHFAAINLPSAWDINPGGRSDVVVAVLDSGLTTNPNTWQFRIWDGRAFRLFGVPMAKASDFEHTRVMVGREFAFGWRWASQGETILFDADGHGTHVAGTIAQQTNNSQGFAGIAHQTTLLPLKVCWAYWDLQLALGAEGSPGWAPEEYSTCPTDAQVEALRYAADAGAKVINMSIGGSFPTPATRDALNYAVSKGAVVTIAAGNEALEGNPTSYPAAYAATIDGVIAVGAVNRQSRRSTYSNHGSYVELVAPGGEGSSSADSVWQMGPSQTDLLFERLAPAFNRYQNYGIAGTSMAAPHVAGVAALLYSQGITKPAAIEAALKRFARDMGAPGRDNEFGAGLVDARASLRGLGVAR
jgi:serine protease